MSKPTENIIKTAREYCNAHRIDFPDKVCAITYIRGHIISVGLNQPYKTHPKAWTAYKTIHAEFAALMDLRRSIPWGDNNLSKYSIYVHRVRRDGKDGLSKPCVYCQQMLDWAGIKEIYYSETSKP